MEWDQMCKRYEKYEDEELELGATEEADQDKRSKTDEKDSCEYEVEKLVAICHGDPNETGKRGIKFQVSVCQVGIKTLTIVKSGWVDVVMLGYI